MIECLYEPFRHWSSMGAVYIISDTHFGDDDCELMDASWPSDEEYIRRLRKQITENDTIVHLGDVGNPTYMDRLPGYKVLICGNHDSRNRCRTYFHEVYDGPLYVAKKLILSHEPMVVPCSVNIHGHCHKDGNGGKPELFPLMDAAKINRAANVCNYEPLNLGRAIKNGLFSGIRDIHRATIDSAANKVRTL